MRTESAERDWEDGNVERDDTMTIDLKEIFLLLWQHAALLIAVVIGCALLGFGATKLFITPQYEATATMIVNSRQDASANVTNDQINSAQKLVDVYSIIIRSDTVLDQVIANLGLSESYNALKSKVTVSAVNSTQVMQITVRDPEPQRARRILAEILRISPDIIQETVEAGSVKIISQPRAGTSPVEPSVSKNTVLAGMLGLLLCAAVLILRRLFDNTVRTGEDITRMFGIPVLGVIPRIDADDMEVRK